MLPGPGANRVGSGDQSGHASAYVTVSAEDFVPEDSRHQAPPVTEAELLVLAVLALLPVVVVILFAGHLTGPADDQNTHRFRRSQREFKGVGGRTGSRDF